MNTKWTFLLFLVISAVIRIPAVYTVKAQTPRLGDSLAPSDALPAYIESQARAYGVDPKIALWITSHESSFDPTRKGDDDQSRGLWQISSIYHPEVSNACAFEASCSTQWSLAWIAKGHVNQWSTWLCRYAWYSEATSTLGPAPAGYQTPAICQSNVFPRLSTPIRPNS